MKILFITPKYPPPPTAPRPDSQTNRSTSERNSFGRGGIGLHVFRLARWFAEEGNEVTVFAYSPGRDGMTKEDGITVCWISLPQNRDALYPETAQDLTYLRERFLSYKALVFPDKERAPDVVHCHDHTVFPIAVEVRRDFRTPIVSTFHYLLSDPRYIKQDSVSEAIRVGESSMCRFSDEVVTVSQWMRNSIAESIGFSEQAIRVVHHGVPIPERNKYQPWIDHWQRTLAPEGERIISFIGRLSPEKGYREHLESARHVLRQLCDVRYAFAGGTSEQVHALRSQITQDRLLHGKVHFLGWIEGDHLAGLRSASYMMVVPSLYESFGYAAVEALAAKVPVVATNAGGLPEIVGHEECGLIVKLRSSEHGDELAPFDLADQQLRLLNNPALRSQYACVGLSRAQREFTIERMIRSTKSIYEAAILQRNGATQDSRFS
jgi:glycogen(starch) synthase